MELALSLGDHSPKDFRFLDDVNKSNKTANKDSLGFCMGLGHDETRMIVGVGDHDRDGANNSTADQKRKSPSMSSSDPPVQLDLLPFSPVPRGGALPTTPSHLRFPWLSENLVAELPGSSSSGRGGAVDVNRRPLRAAEEGEDSGAALSSPNSAASTFQMDFSIYRRNGRSGKRDFETAMAANDQLGEAAERGASSRASDEDENGINARKKLRLTKEQSAFLEESFKEHNTLNPKQKLALAKQLNLRPRQVEVWFQNRRARTKLKQTEVDCEYLKRCCETLTEENRRLQKELQELRALKASQPFYMQLPPTTLTMCPSCERVSSSTATAAPPPTAAANPPPALSLAKPKLFSIFPPAPVHAPQAAS